MGRADWTDELEFSTVNGGITLILPGKLDTEVCQHGERGNRDRLAAHGFRALQQPAIRGTIGAGGRALSLST